VENKALRQYTTKSLVEGTAPTQTADRSTQQASTSEPASTEDKAVKPAAVVSPLDEMNKQLPETDKAKAAKNAKKPTKVAKNK